MHSGGGGWKRNEYLKLDRKLDRQSAVKTIENYQAGYGTMMGTCVHTANYL